MTEKICSANCIHFIEGRCRLEHRPTEIRPFCPGYTGQGVRGGI